jgi:hypothetical protein
MAFLLAMYQKMRLTREKNQAQFDQTKYSSKLSRVQKNIERQQKLFESRLAKLEQDAKMMQSQATSVFQQMAGLGTGNFSNATSPYGFTGMNGFVSNVVGQMLMQGGYKYKNSSGNEDFLGAMSQQEVQGMMSEYMANGKFLPKMDGDKPVQGEYANWKPEQVAAFMTAMQAGQMQQQQAQMWAGNMNTQYQQNVSIWLDARKAEIEAEQDAVLEPLKYQETMWELEKNQAETKLERIKAELETYNNLCKEEIQNAAPKFGLG